MKKGILFLLIIGLLLVPTVYAESNLEISNVQVKEISSIQYFFNKLFTSLAVAPSSAKPGDTIEGYFAIIVPYPSDNFCLGTPYIYLYYVNNGKCVSGQYLGRYTGAIDPDISQMVTFDMKIPSSWDGKYTVTGLIECNKHSFGCVIGDQFSDADLFTIDISTTGPECISSWTQCEGPIYWNCIDGKKVQQGIIKEKCGIECKTDSDCVNNKECSNYICVEIATPDEKRVCQGESCVIIEGQGMDECNVDEDCKSIPPNYRKTCNEQEACVLVQEEGENLCVLDSDCTNNPPIPKIWVIVDDSCVYTEAYPGVIGYSTEESCEAVINRGFWDEYEYWVYVGAVSIVVLGIFIIILKRGRKR